MRTLNKQRLLTLFLVALLPMQVLVSAQGTDTSYTSDEFGITIEWTDEWQPSAPLEAGATVLTFDRGMSVILVVGFLDGGMFPPEDAVWLAYSEDAGDEVLEDRSTEDIPVITYVAPASNLVFTAEAYSIDGGETTVFVSVGTVPVLQDSAFNLVQTEVTFNGNPPFTADHSTEVEVPEDLTGIGTAEAVEEETETTGRTSRTTSDGDSTPEATEETTGRTSRTSRDASETPEATATEEEESTSVITRTPREGSGTTETPEATEAPTEDVVEPTEDVIESQGADSYTGPNYGYTFTFDPNIWELDDSFELDGIDLARLDGETATVFFVGTDEYGADPVGCLIGESEYYGVGNESFMDWAVANDANGDPLWFESDELAWGVFTYTYGDVELVDYISCETIPGHDAVLIVQLTSLPGDYNTNLDYVLDVLDTIEFQP